MTKEDKASAYANEAELTFKEVIKAAYLKGFEDGFNSVSVDKSRIIGDLKFIDLGLPSGNLWCFYKNINSSFSFSEAVDLGLPTVEELNELVSCCGISYDYGTIHFSGKNGNNLRCYINNVRKVWYAQDYDKSSSGTYAYRLDAYNIKEKTFSQDRLPVLLVRKPS